MWLSLTQNIKNTPIGLISSVGLPNLNGMILLAKFLNYLPSLWWVSFFLGSFQTFLILCLGFLLFKENKIFYLFIFTLLFNVAITSNSTHFSNQFMLTSLNIIYLIFLALYLNKPSSLKLSIQILPIMLAPALYLGGMPNGLAFLICSLVAFYFNPFVERPINLFLSFVFTIILIIIFLKFIWIPYFSAGTISFISETSFLEKFKLVLKAISNFPNWSTLIAAGDLSGTFNHNGGDITTYPHWSLVHNTEEYLKKFINFYGILSNSTLISLKLSSLLLIIQSIISNLFLILSLGYCYFKFRSFKNIFINKEKKIIKFLLFSVMFIFLSYLFGVQLSPEMWLNGQRPDQQANLLPIFIIIWFLIPFYFSINQTIDNLMKKMTMLISIIYLFLNIYSGYKISDEHLKYNGRVLTNADVPLVQKEQVVNYIANDWKLKTNSRVIKVSYYLGGGRWDWADSFGENYSMIYPGVYTIGREFDFEFLHSFNLINYQEGIQHRSFKNSKYIVCYNFMPYPINDRLILESKKFGRLMVLVLKD
jgi:hypothetical protein